ncbi:hypothetical protein PHMEG_00019043, partial [Phytophthora megakarya]
DDSSSDEDNLFYHDNDENDATTELTWQIRELTAMEEMDPTPRFEIAQHRPLGKITPFRGRLDESENYILTLRLTLDPPQPHIGSERRVTIPERGPSSDRAEKEEELLTAKSKAVEAKWPSVVCGTSVNELLQQTLDSSDFAAGVWGVCTDVEFSSEANTSATFDHCYLFQTSSKYDVTDVDSSLMVNFSNYSLCDRYSRAGDESNDTQLQYASALATIAGMDAVQFIKLLDKSCSAPGSATLAFGAISMSTGVLSFVGLTLASHAARSASSWVLR